jgi:hypothetical protein
MAQDDAITLSQRLLAGKAGLSLGMTNVLLRRFVERGWVKLTHITSRKLRYILTNEGICEILRRSAAYFSRAARSAALYRKKIDNFVGTLSDRGITTVVLEGPADFDVLIEYACEKKGIRFFINPKPKIRDILISDSSTIFLLTSIPSRTIPTTKETPLLLEGPHYASIITLEEILFSHSNTIA